MTSKAVAVHVEAPLLKEALGHLPPAALAKKGEFVPYTNSSFKVAPRWKEMEPYRDTLRALLGASGGERILHKSMFSGVLHWAKHEGIELDNAILEKGTYALRAMICQMANHKNHDPPREVPTKFKKTLEPIFDMVVSSKGTRDHGAGAWREEGSGQASDSDDDVVVVPCDRPSPEDVMSISDADSEARDMGRLFHTSDPDLQKLLQDGSAETKRRLTTKTHDPQRSMTVDGFSNEEVRMLTSASPEQPLDPKGFTKLNAKMKKDRLAKNNSKGQKTVKGKKKPPMKAKVKANKSSEANLVYSHHYHKVMRELKKSGIDVEECKVRARQAGRAAASPVAVKACNGTPHQHVLFSILILMINIFSILLLLCPSSSAGWRCQAFWGTACALGPVKTCRSGRAEKEGSAGEVKPGKEQEEEKEGGG
eukprot:3254742-Pyramimonas_sp.AAC.1